MSARIARTAAVVAVSALSLSGAAGIASAQGSIDAGSIGAEEGAGSASGSEEAAGSIGEIDSETLLRVGGAAGSVALGSVGANALGIDLNGVIFEALTPVVDVFWSVVWSAAGSTISVPPVGGSS